MPANNGQWRRIPAVHLKPPGQTGAGTATLAMRSAIGLLAIAVVWHLFVALRPLPNGASEATRTPPPAADFAWPTPALESRQAALDSMLGVNHYADNHQLWSTPVVTDTDAPPEDGESVRKPTTKLSIESNPGDLRIDDVESLPEDIKQARESLKLRGIRTGASGDLFAQISLVHSKDPIASSGYRVGDTFTDPKHASAEWRLIGIDPIRDRAILERTGKNIALELYPYNPFATSAAVDTIAATLDPNQISHGIDGRTRQEVVAELLQADLSPDEIRALLDMIEAETLPELIPDPIPDPEVVAEKMRKARMTAPAPSSDMELLIRLMTSGQNPVEFMEQQAEQSEPENEDG